MAGALGLCPLLTGGVSATSACDRAERLAAFDLGAARTEYVKLLESEAPPDCAMAAYPSVATRHRQVMEILARVEDEVPVGR